MNNLSLSIANNGLNMPALDCYGHTTSITAYLADRYSNFAVKGTSVNFFTEGGAISPYIVTNANGLAVATLQAQGPAPQDVGPGAYYQCGFNTCLHPCTPERWATDLFYGPHHTYNPRDGVNTILITTIGEESFDDKNGNGIYDSGEVFVDLSEPYLDADDDRIYDYAEPFTDGVDVYGNAWSSKNQTPDKYDPPTPWVDNNLIDDDTDGYFTDCDAPATDCNNRWDSGEICLGNLENRTVPSQDCNQNPSGCVCFPGEGFKDKWLPGRTSGDGMWNEAEFYIDYNSNGRFDGPNGIWDAQIMIWTTISNLFTSSNTRSSIYKVDSAGCDSPPATIDITGTGTNYFVLDLSDENYNPLDTISVGFAVSSDTSANCTVFPSLAYVNADPIGQAWTHFEFTVTGKAAGPCEVDITATWSNTCGSYKATDTLTGQVK
ncbi:MAG: Ig-like domain-containing protein [Proteobacteria bacterium]|nr:Ig-like domain-containing protein [Pseudomonadota bacterium]